MAHQVFICYSTRDKHVADAACAALEAQHILCWIAPRNVLPGVGYMGAIVDALTTTQIVVLIFSQAANDSTDVQTEIGLAFKRKKVVVPFRIENVLPGEDMEYALGTRHWLDAFTPPLERHLSELCETISRLIERQSTKPAAAPEPKPVSPQYQEPEGVEPATVHETLAEANLRVRATIPGAPLPTAVPLPPHPPEELEQMLRARKLPPAPPEPPAPLHGNPTPSVRLMQPVDPPQISGTAPGTRSFWDRFLGRTIAKRCMALSSLLAAGGYLCLSILITIIEWPYLRGVGERAMGPAIAALFFAVSYFAIARIGKRSILRWCAGLFLLKGAISYGYFLLTDIGSEHYLRLVWWYVGSNMVRSAFAVPVLFRVNNRLTRALLSLASAVAIGWEEYEGLSYFRSSFLVPILINIAVLAFLILSIKFDLPDEMDRSVADESRAEGPHLSELIK